MRRLEDALVKLVSLFVLNLRTLQGIVALVCIVVGVAFIFWPAALIVAGVLLAYDRVT